MRFGCRNGKGGALFLWLMALPVLLLVALPARSDVLLQGFYWDVPSPAAVVITRPSFSALRRRPSPV